jgi:hypothetical protein
MYITYATVKSPTSKEIQTMPKTHEAPRIEPEQLEPLGEGESNPFAEMPASTSSESVEEVPMSPEVAEAVKQEQEIRYQDVELLGKRYSVQRVIHENSVQYLQKKQESMVAKYHNALDTPGKWAREFSHSLAESKANRKQAKYDEVAHLSDTNLLKQRRLARLHKAEEQRDQKKLRLDERTDRMTARRQSVVENANKRRQEYISELKDRREQALGRKALRHELRQQGAGWHESRAITKEIIESMPREHLTRVGELATIAHRSEKVAQKAERGERKLAKQEQTLVTELSTNETRTTQYAQEARDAHRVTAEIHDTHLPAAQQRVAELQAQLSEMTDDDPDREQVLVTLQQAEERVKVYVERELPYWSATARKNEQYVVMLQQQRISLKQQLETHKESRATHSEQTDVRRDTMARHAGATSSEAQRIINGEQEN